MTRDRQAFSDFYASERPYLNECLVEGVSVLDIGCAWGGLCDAMGERLARFHYTGVDVSEERIKAARARNPRRRFIGVEPSGHGMPVGEKFDVVVALGILHTTPDWTTILREGWALCAGALIFDLRETAGPGVASAAPYIVLNRAMAAAAVAVCCPGSAGITFNGYRHALDAAAPVREAYCTVYKVTR